jgi:hypothetical protein
MLDKVNKDDFLPKDYELPETPSNYARFQEGINRFRILSSAITGYEYFNTDNKPVRSKEAFESTPDLKKNGKVKVFWAFVVWNYQTKSIQILELTQKTIMNAIKGFISNEKWGSPFSYDIAITKTGEGLDTEYQTQAEPPIGEPSDEVKEAFMDKPVQLGALFVNEDPFEKL